MAQLTTAERIFRAPIAALQGVLSDGAATLYRRHSIEDADLGQELGSLTLSGDHSDGATSLDLISADAGPIRGTIPDGLTLTISGTDYTVDGEATVSSDLVTVALTSGLSGTKTDGAVVTLASAVSYGGASSAWAQSTAGPVRVDELPPDLVGVVTRRVVLRRQRAPATPLKDDELEIGSTRGRIAEITTSPAAWTCFLEVA